MKANRLSIAAWIGVATAAVLAIAGCSGSEDETSRAAGATRPVQLENRLAEMVAAGPVLSAGQSSSVYAGSANVLATSKHPVADYARNASIRLGVVGVVSGYAEGPNFEEYEGDVGGRTTVMAVTVVGMIKGDAPASGKVYVQMAGAARPDLAAKALPVGTPVALMVSKPTMTASVNPGAGRPAGDPVWIAGAQGLIVSNGPGRGVSYPRADLADPDVRLDDLVITDLKSLGLSLRPVD